MKKITYAKRIASGEVEVVADGAKRILGTGEENELLKLLGDRSNALEKGIDLKTNPIEIKGAWAKNLYGMPDSQYASNVTKNIVEDVTGGKVEVLDMGLLISDKLKPWYESGYARPNTPLVPKDLKVGMRISEGGMSSDYIITDILGEGKFKAVPKEKYIDAQKMSEKELIHNYGYGKKDLVNQYKREFDISTKTTTQQGIKLTPEIKAKIRGEAPALKQPSGKVPYKEGLLQKARRNKLNQN